MFHRQPCRHRGGKCWQAAPHGCNCAYFLRSRWHSRCIRFLFSHQQIWEQLQLLFDTWYVPHSRNPCQCSNIPPHGRLVFFVFAATSWTFISTLNFKTHKDIQEELAQQGLGDVDLGKGSQNYLVQIGLSIRGFGESIYVGAKLVFTNRHFICMSFTNIVVYIDAMRMI